MQKFQEVTPESTHTVIEALYDLPLGGSWRDLQEALCRYWFNFDEQPPAAELDLLERHFKRALSFLERLPAEESRWRNELYRIPVPACVFGGSGELIDANAQGRALLGLGEEDIRPLSVPSAEKVRRACHQLVDRELAATEIKNLQDETLRLYLSKLPDAIHGPEPMFLGVVVNSDLPTDGLTLLAGQFGLTESEARLCLRLSAGSSLDEVAKDARVKKTTLRTHLANSFNKLGVNSQPELVALVLHSMFAGALLHRGGTQAPELTPYLDPELHGYPKFQRLTLADGRTLGYFEYGDRDGVPAFYLHGSLDSGLMMKSQRLNGNGIRLFAVERGGVGESSPNPDPSARAYARDLKSLAEHLGLRKYAVIGRSMGSWDAVALALEDSERVRLLVLAGGRLPVASRADHKRHSSFYRALYNAIWHSDTLGHLMLRAMQIQILVKGPQYFMAEEGLPPVELDLVSNETYQRHMKAVWLRSACHGPAPINDHLRLYREPLAEPPWLGLSTQTLLIHGAQDSNVSADTLIEQTDSFENREVVLLPDVGHRLVHVAMGEVLRRTRDTWDKFI